MYLPTADGATPAIAQRFAVKALHPDALVVFRMVDFYEHFFSDVVLAAGFSAAAVLSLCGMVCLRSRKFRIDLLTKKANRRLRGRRSGFLAMVS